jgi:hypothetical protein
LQMSGGEFCRRFGWSHEKYRKVAQRGRAQLRRLLAEPPTGEAAPRPPRKSFQAACPVFEGVSE